MVNSSLKPKKRCSALHSSDWASSAVQTCTEFVALPQNCFLVAKYTLSIPSNNTHLANFYICSYGRVARDPSSFPLFPGSAAGAAALKNPGAGPAPVSSPEAFGGNRRLYTLAAPAADPPPTYLRSIPVHDYRCNLQCILRVVFKNHRFLQGFGPLGGAELRLGDVKKCGFFHSFYFAGRKKSKKIVSEDVFNLNGANIGPT